MERTPIMAPRPKAPATADEAFTALLEQATRTYPRSVILADGESVAGTFLRLESGPTRDYGNQPVVVFNELTSGEERCIWLLHTALKSQFARANPAVGAKFVVVNLGKRLAKTSGREYADYKVVVEGAPDAPAPGAMTFDQVAESLAVENGDGGE
jgi:hypothetical protein